MHPTNESKTIGPRGFQLDCFMHDRCVRNNYVSRDDQLAAYFIWLNQTVKWPAAAEDDVIELCSGLL